MTILKTLSVSLLAGSMLFGAVGCSASDTGNNPAPSAGISNVDQEAQDKKQIVSLINELYDYCAQPDKMLAMQELGLSIDRGASDSEVAKHLLEGNPEAFAYYDTSENLDVAMAYLNMANISSALLERDYKNMTITEDDVTVDGDTATVDESNVGSTITSNMSPDVTIGGDGKTVELVKKDGKWLIKAPVADMK